MNEYHWEKKNDQCEKDKDEEAEKISAFKIDKWQPEKKTLNEVMIIWVLVVFREFYSQRYSPNRIDD